jgi:hypothetical protein
MPTCTTCHVAAISAAQSAGAVRDIGIVGALSIAAMPVLAIRRKQTVADVRVVSSISVVGLQPRGEYV